jgi:hypothetical protein
MVSTILVSEKQEAGKRLVELLDKENVIVGAAFWYLYEDEEEWRLVIAMPMVDQSGPASGYDLVLRIRRDQASILSTSEIVVVGMRDRKVLLLGKMIQTGPGLSGIRLSRNVINGTYVEDAYIYRLLQAA